MYFSCSQKVSVWSTSPGCCIEAAKERRGGENEAGGRGGADVSLRDESPGLCSQAACACSTAEQSQRFVPLPDNPSNPAPTQTRLMLMMTVKSSTPKTPVVWAFGNKQSETPNGLGSLMT